MSTRLLKITLLVTAMFPISGMIALAQEPATPHPAAKPDAAAPVQPAAENKMVVTKGKDTLTVDFPDTEIREVLRSVADMFELNLVIPETLQGKTSIKLRDVTWRQVYQVVLQPVGYTFVEDSNIIKVVTQESLNLEPLTTEVFILNYAKAAEIKPALDSLVDSKVGGKIVVDARSNALVVTERGSVMQKLKPVIQNLDRPTEQVMIESKFIEVSNNDSKNLGVNWASLGGTGQQIGFTNLNKAYVTQSTKNPTTSDTQAISSSSGVSSLTEYYNKTDRVTTALLSADGFYTYLKALQSLSNTKLVSNPTVVTLNNTEANINSGYEIPIPNFTYNQEQGAYQISGFTYKPVGVLLKVTPQVNNTGFIKLTVEPEVSEQNDELSSKYGTFGTAVIPVIKSRKTKTQVTMKDGYTLAIGGMISRSDTKVQNKVPVLGNIPVLGRLFRSDDDNQITSNLVIFLTAKTIKPDGGDISEVFDPRVTREMEIQKSDMPGYRDGSNSYYTPPPPEPKKKGWFSKE